MVARSLLRHASTLARKRGPRSKPPALQPQSSRPRSVRNEVTSPALCDDILQRLQPRLPAPNTCDVIDINPGRGLWSQKLHAILQPRRHILLEPDLADFTDYLHPLLEEPHSRYKHAFLLDDVLDPSKGFLSEYPTQNTGARSQPTQLNKSLLLTVNLSGALTTASGFQGSPSKRFFNNLYLSMWGIRGNLHRYGHVRVLAWVPDHEKDVYVPRTVAARRKQSVMMEASSTVYEVAGAARLSRDLRSQFDRWTDLDQEDYDRVEAASTAAAVYTPANRLAAPPPPHLLTVEPSPATLRTASFTSGHKFVAQFLEVDDYLRENDAEWYKTAVDMLAQKRGLSLPVADETQERYDWRHYLNRLRTEHNTRAKAADLVNQQRDLERQWKEAIEAAGDNASLASSVNATWRSRADLLKKKLQKLAKNNKYFAEKAVDDYRSYDHQPRVLSWNQREVEPLVVHDDEFLLSHHSMALLDIHPKADFTTRLDSYDRMICFDYVMTMASSHFGKNVYHFLSLLIPAGVDDFIKTIPGVHDPTKGGWYDLTMLRIRSLPPNMFVEIALAYEKWPFRLTIENILMLAPDPQAEFSLDDE